MSAADNAFGRVCLSVSVCLSVKGNLVGANYSLGSGLGLYILVRLLSTLPHVYIC